MIEVTQRELLERLEWQERLMKRDAKADPVIVFCIRHYAVLARLRVRCWMSWSLWCPMYNCWQRT